MKINWAVIKKDYIEDSTLSYQDLADKYGVSKKQIGVWSKKERWPESRQEVHEKGLLRFQQNQIEVIAETNNRHSQAYRSIQNQCLVIIDDLRSSNNTDPQKLYKATQTLRLAIDGERVVLGLPIISVKAEPVTSNTDFDDFTTEQLEEIIYSGLERDIAKDPEGPLAQRIKSILLSTDETSLNDQTILKD